MQSLPAEMLCCIFNHLDVTSLARFALSNSEILAVFDEEKFYVPWFESFRFPVVVEAIALRNFRGCLDAFRFVRDTVITAQTILKVAGPLFLCSSDKELPQFLSYLKATPNDNIAWYNLWSACLTGNWLLAYAFYNGRNFRHLDGMDHEDATGVYFDLLFQKGKWEEAKKSLHPSRLSSSHWCVSKVPEPWRSSLFVDASPRPGFAPKGGKSFRIVYDVRELLRVLDENPDSSAFYKWRMLTVPFFSAKLIADRIVDSTNSKFCATMALCARGETPGDFISNGLGFDDAMLTLPPLVWKESCKQEGGYSPCATMCKAMFMREGLGDDDIEPLYKIIQA